MHRRFAPTGEVAGPLYDSLEEPRVEVLGSQRMAGVRANLEAVHRARVSPPQPGQQGQDATVAEIIDLYAREQIRASSSPRGSRSCSAAGASGSRATWRASWARCGAASPTRSSSPAVCGTSLAHLGLSEQLDEQPDDGESEDQGEEEQPQDQGEEGGEPDGDAESEGETTSRLEQDAKGEQSAEEEPQPAQAEEVQSEPGGEDSAEETRSTGPSSSRPAASRWPTRSSPPIRRGRAAEELCDPGRADRACAPSSTSSWPASRA